MLTDRGLFRSLLFLVPLILVGIVPFNVSDLCVWIPLGEHFLRFHEILRHDVFSVLPSAPMIYPAWGISILYAAIYRLGGLLADCLFHWFLVLPLLLWVIYRNSIFRADRLNRKAIAVLCVSWIGALPAFSPRPSMIAEIPLCLAFVLIDKLDSKITRKEIGYLFFLSVLWVNLHGSFILLPIMLFWKIALIQIENLRNGASQKGTVSLYGGFLAALAGSLINPFGARVYPYVFRTAWISRDRHLQEWQSPFFLNGTATDLVAAKILFVIVLAAALAFFLQRYREGRLFSVLKSPFVPLLICGLLSIRSACLVFLVLLPFSYSSGWIASNLGFTFGKRPSIKNTAFLCAFLAVFAIDVKWLWPALWHPDPTNESSLYDKTAVPEIARAIAKTKKTCPIFNSLEVGGYLMMSLPNRIFLDTRNIIYSEADWTHYRTAIGGISWENWLDQYSACLAVLDRETAAPLISQMLKSKRWQLVQEEKGIAFLQRADSKLP